MTLILILFFIKSPTDAIMHNGLELLDVVPPKEIMEELNQVIQKYKPEFFKVHRMRTRKAGKRLFVDICSFSDKI